MTFYNTTNLTGQELTQGVDSATSQMEAVFELFNNNPDKKFTAWDVENELKRTGNINEQVPIHSIRARITTLKNDGQIKKLNELCKSPHGMKRSEHYYKLKEKLCPAGYSEIQPTDYAQNTHD